MSVCPSFSLHRPAGVHRPPVTSRTTLSTPTPSCEDETVPLPPPCMHSSHCQPAAAVVVCRPCFFVPLTPPPAQTDNDFSARHSRSAAAAWCGGSGEAGVKRVWQLGRRRGGWRGRSALPVLRVCVSHSPAAGRCLSPRVACVCHTVQLPVGACLPVLRVSHSPAARRCLSPRPACTRPPLFFSPCFSSRPALVLLFLSPCFSSRPALVPLSLSSCSSPRPAIPLALPLVLLFLSLFPSSCYSSRSFSRPAIPLGSQDLDTIITSLDDLDHTTMN